MEDKSFPSSKRKRRSIEKVEDMKGFSKYLTEMLPQQMLGAQDMQKLDKEELGIGSVQGTRKIKEVCKILTDFFLLSFATNDAEKNEVALSMKYIDDVILTAISANKSHISLEHYLRILIKKYFEYFNPAMNDTATGTKHIFLGSSSDGLGIPVLFDKKHKTHLEISDVDIMMVLSPPCYPAVKYRRESEATTEAALLVDGRGCHPGYVKLVIQGEHFLFDVPGILDHGTICMSNKFMQVFIEDPVLRKGTLENILERAEVTFNGPAVSFRLPLISGVERNVVLTGDIAASFPWNKWPHEADEWLSRERTSGWPNVDQTKAVEELGCHLVPVANPGNKDCQTEWRISFVLAERHLALSLNEGQRRVYRIIKLIHKHRLGDLGVLSTYHLKTTLFWLCERIPQDRWTDEEMGQRFYDFFDLLLGFLSIKCIPNYFIPENNMIDYVDEQLVNENANILQDILHEPKTILEEIQTRYDLHFDPLHYLFSELPLGNFFQTCTLSPELDIERGSLADTLDATDEMLIELSEKHPDSLMGPILKALDAFPGNESDNPFRLIKGEYKEAMGNLTRKVVDLMANQLGHAFKPLADRILASTYNMDGTIELFAKISDVILGSDSDQKQTPAKEHADDQEAATREILYLRNQECDDQHYAKRESLDSLDEDQSAPTDEKDLLLEFVEELAGQLEELDLELNQKPADEHADDQEAASRETLYLRNQGRDDQHNAKRESFNSLVEDQIAPSGLKKNRLLGKRARQFEELDLD